MSNEIKEEKSKAGLITGIVVIIAVIAGGIMLFKPSNNGKVQEQKVVTATTAPKPKTEKTVARIDITTKLADAKKTQFEVYVDGSKTPEKQAEWMHKFGNQGYTIEKDSGTKDIVIKALNDVNIKISLRGKKGQVNKEKAPRLVKYTVFSINDEKILKKDIVASYEKSFNHVIKAKAGEEYKIHLEWKK